MTELLYLKDSYLRKFTAAVKWSEDRSLTLDRTAFYPGGGGQPPDRGTLTFAGKTLQVVGYARRDGDPVHLLDRPAPPPGSQVEGAIDWPLRYAHMRHHTALHILSAAVYRLYGGLVTGGQIHHDRARLDFDLNRLDQEQVAAIEEEVNRVVGEKRPVKIRFLPREEALALPGMIKTRRVLVPEHLKIVRVVEIEGYDQQADGGTHVANTGEVGRVRVVKVENKGRVNRRIVIALEPPPK